MKHPLQFRVALVALGLAIVAAVPEAKARQRGEEPAQPAAQLQQQRRGQPGRRGPAAQNGRLQRLFEQLVQLPPDEQKRFLENSPAFEQMPPEAQQRLRQRLDRFNALPAEQRQAELRRLRRRGRGGQVGAQQLFLRVAPLSPEEQEKVLATDAFFQSRPPRFRQRFRQRLRQFNQEPPARRRRMLQNMRRFNQLGPGEQRRLQERARIFGQMTPQQRRRAQRIFREWQQLLPERRQLLTERLQRLQRSSAEQRRRLLQEDDFLSGLQPAERSLLKALVELRTALPSNRP